MDEEFDKRSDGDDITQASGKNLENIKSNSQNLVVVIDNQISGITDQTPETQLSEDQPTEAQPSEVQPETVQEEEETLCDCCHCHAMRCTLKRIAYLKTPEGQRRFKMKMFAKNLFMDITAMSEVRARLLDSLSDGRTKYPPPSQSYPVSICEASHVTNESILIKWYVHDTDSVDRYEICIDNCLTKRVYDPNLKSTIIVGADAKCMHKIIMCAIPRKSAAPIDLMVQDICCGLIKPKEKEDMLYKCLQNPTLDPRKKKYLQMRNKSIMNYWKPSEFLYLPPCDHSYIC